MKRAWTDALMRPRSETDDVNVMFLLFDDSRVRRRGGWSGVEFGNSGGESARYGCFGEFGVARLHILSGSVGEVQYSAEVVRYGGLF